MALRSSVMKWRVVLVSVVAGGFLGNAALMLVGVRSRARHEAIDDARTFAELTKARLCSTYDPLHRAGPTTRHRLAVADMMMTNRDVRRIRLVDMEGFVVADSDAAPDAQAVVGDAPPRIETGRLPEIRNRDGVVHVSADGWRVQMVAPCLEEWGVHRLTLIYDVDVARRVRWLWRATAWRTFGAGAVAAIGTSLVLMTLLRRTP